MSSYEDESDPIENMGDAANRFQKFIQSIPVQTKLVSELSANEANRLSREVGRLRVGPSRKAVRRVKAPTIKQDDIPEVPHIPRKIPRMDSSFAMFAGKRRKVKSGMAILTVK